MTAIARPPASAGRLPSSIVPLRALAHCRSGDKGTLTTVALIAHSEALYPLLEASITAELVAEQLSSRVAGAVVRYEMEAARTLIFVCARSPGDMVTTSLERDAHGKTLSSRLLDLLVEIPHELLALARQPAGPAS